MARRSLLPSSASSGRLCVKGKEGELYYCLYEVSCLCSLDWFCMRFV